MIDSADSPFGMEDAPVAEGVKSIFLERLRPILDEFTHVLVRRRNEVREEFVLIDYPDAVTVDVTSNSFTLQAHPGDDEMREYREHVNRTGGCTGWDLESPENPPMGNMEIGIYATYNVAGAATLHCDPRASIGALAQVHTIFALLSGDDDLSHKLFSGEFEKHLSTTHIKDAVSQKNRREAHHKVLENLLECCEQDEELNQIVSALFALQHCRTYDDPDGSKRVAVQLLRSVLAEECRSAENETPSNPHCFDGSGGESGEKADVGHGPTIANSFDRHTRYQIGECLSYLDSLYSGAPVDEALAAFHNIELRRFSELGDGFLSFAVYAYLQDRVLDWYQHRYKAAE